MLQHHASLHVIFTLEYVLSLIYCIFLSLHYSDSTNEAWHMFMSHFPIFLSNIHATAYVAHIIDIVHKECSLQ